MAHSAELPRKTRELHNHHMDSTIWNRFAFRDDDVIVATSPAATPRAFLTNGAQGINLHRLLTPGPSLVLLYQPDASATLRHLTSAHHSSSSSSHSFSRRWPARI